VPLIHIPALLLPVTGGLRQQQGSGKTVRDLIGELDRLYPGIRDRLLDSDRLRSGLAVFVDGLVRREGLDFEVSDQSEIHFIPAVAGGSSAKELLASSGRQSAKADQLVFLAGC